LAAITEHLEAELSFGRLGGSQRCPQCRIAARLGRPNNKSNLDNTEARRRTKEGTGERGKALFNSPRNPKENFGARPLSLSLSLSLARSCLRGGGAGLGGGCLGGGSRRSGFAQRRGGGLLSGGALAERLVALRFGHLCGVRGKV
jgi:hypothetical protein